ncbi:UNVERIFIED_CONTAM: hypothetical protein Cloal_1189 [Acetivibrio alkalicellulosi]
MGVFYYRDRIGACACLRSKQIARALDKRFYSEKYFQNIICEERYYGGEAFKS